MRQTETHDEYGFRKDGTPEYRTRFEKGKRGTVKLLHPIRDFEEMKRLWRSGVFFSTTPSGMRKFYERRGEENPASKPYWDDRIAKLDERRHKRQEKRRQEREKIHPEACPKYEYPLTRYIIGWKGEKWRCKPPMSREDFEESQATYQYGDYKEYLGHSSYLNLTFDKWAWAHNLPPTETMTHAITELFNHQKSIINELRKKIE